MSGTASSVVTLAMVSGSGAWLASINVRAVAGYRVRLWVEAAFGCALVVGIARIFYR